MSEKFNLHWNDFQSNILQTFKRIRKDKDFLNVTLVTEDEAQLEAHKVILSASSPFLENILKKSPHQHPMLFLSGISSFNLNLILDYVYFGEVQVHQDHLPEFLSSARKLQVSGLSNMEEVEDSICDNEEVIKIEPEINVEGEGAYINVEEPEPKKKSEKITVAKKPQGDTDYHTKFLGPLTSAMGNMGYDVQVMCLPKSSSSDLPILTEGNVTIARAKVIICQIFYSYTINSLYHRMLLLALVIRIQLLGTSHFPKVTMLSGNLILTSQHHTNTFVFRDLFKNQNQMRRYASSVLRCLLSEYGVTIGTGTFYFWLTKFPVSQFDPAVQVFIDTLLNTTFTNPSKEILQSSGQYRDTICLENFYKWREFKTHTVMIQKEFTVY